jgi:IS5 family transposase
MLRICFLQQWFNLSDPAAEEALCDSAAMSAFAGIDLANAPAPDETTICRFCHLLEQHDLGRCLFEEVHVHLERNGLKVAAGTIVETTIINAPSSTQPAREWERLQRDMMPLTSMSHRSSSAGEIPACHSSLRI